MKPSEQGSSIDDNHSLSVCFAFSEVYQENPIDVERVLGCGITRPGSSLTRNPCVTFHGHVTSVVLLGHFLPLGTGVEGASETDHLRKTQWLS